MNVLLVKGPMNFNLADLEENVRIAALGLEYAACNALIVLKNVPSRSSDDHLDLESNIGLSEPAFVLDQRIRVSLL